MFVYCASWESVHQALPARLQGIAMTERCDLPIYTYLHAYEWHHSGRSREAVHADTVPDVYTVKQHVRIASKTSFITHFYSLENNLGSKEVGARPKISTL